MCRNGLFAATNERIKSSLYFKWIAQSRWIYFSHKKSFPAREIMFMAHHACAQTLLAHLHRYAKQKNLLNNVLLSKNEQDADHKIVHVVC